MRSSPFPPYHVATLRRPAPGIAARGGTATPRRPALHGELAERVLRALPLGVALFGADGELLWANRVMRKMLRGCASANGATSGAQAELGQAALALDSAPTDDEPGWLGTLRSGGALLELRGVRLDRDIVLLTLEPAAARGPTDDELRGRYGLTPREVRVARLLADGLSNAALAAALEISPHTARAHTERVRRKIGVPSRAQLAALMHGGVATPCR